MARWGTQMGARPCLWISGLRGLALVSTPFNRPPWQVPAMVLIAAACVASSVAAQNWTPPPGYNPLSPSEPTQAEIDAALPPLPILPVPGSTTPLTPPQGATQNPLDPAHAFDPGTGDNYFWDPNKNS